MQRDQAYLQAGEHQLREGVLTCPARPLQGAKQPATTISRELHSLVEAVQQQGSTSAALQRSVEVGVGCRASMRNPPRSCTIWTSRPTHNAVLYHTRLQHSWPHVLSCVPQVVVPSCSHLSLAHELQDLDVCREL